MFAIVRSAMIAIMWSAMWWRTAPHDSSSNPTEHPRPHSAVAE